MSVRYLQLPERVGDSADGGVRPRRLLSEPLRLPSPDTQLMVLRETVANSAPAHASRGKRLAMNRRQGKAMKNKLIYPLIVVVGVACGRDAVHKSQQQYETVQEGSASGVTSTIQGPGETLPPITGTNSDTTTAFTINPNLAGAAPVPAQPTPNAIGSVPRAPLGSTPFPGTPATAPVTSMPASQAPPTARPAPSTAATAPARPVPAREAPRPVTPPQTETVAPPPQTDTSATTAPAPKTDTTETTPPPEDTDTSKTDTSKTDTTKTDTEEEPPPPPPPPPY